MGQFARYALYAWGAMKTYINFAADSAARLPIGSPCFLSSHRGLARLRAIAGATLVQSRRRWKLT
jgi:hypothetical protein